jgi:hypothetical protein
MNKKIIISVFGLLILFVGIWYWSRISQNNAEGQIINREAPLILFYGEECPHCKDLEKFIADNNIGSKIIFEQLEVFHDKKASAFFVEKAKECGITNEKTLGVPFFYARGKCLTGTPDIEEFLKKEAEI